MDAPNCPLLIEAQSAPKIAPEGVALRAAPRAVARLNRRTLAVCTTLLAVAVAGASMWPPQSKGRRGSSDQTNLYNVDWIAKADDLDQLPADYSKLPPKPSPAVPASVPQLGPPLLGDWGAASAMPLLPGGNVNPGPSAENIDRQRQADEIARSAVFFGTGITLVSISVTVYNGRREPLTDRAHQGDFRVPSHAEG